MVNSEPNDMRDLERKLNMLVHEFQQAIADGKPFIEVKGIYMDIKELKMMLSHDIGGRGDWAFDSSSAFLL